MGMESFFVMMLADGIQQEKDEFGIRKYVGKSDISRDIFIEYLKNNFNLKQSNSIILENLLEVKIDIDEFNNIKTVFFECCFYHYNKGLEIIFQIAEKIKKDFKMKLFHPATNFLDNVKQDIFRSKIKSFYENKYIAFIKDFGSSPKNYIVLPNAGFTNYLKEIGRIK